MPRKKTIAFGFLPVLMSLMAVLLAACGTSGPATGPVSAGSTPASVDKQVLRFPIGATDFGTVDPALVQSATDNYPIQAIFTGLEQLNDKGIVVDQLAASHQISSDGLTYTFTLRPNLKFSDGTTLTSQDVVYSINRLIDPATKSQVAYYMALIKDYDAANGGKIKTLIGDSLLAPDPSTVKIIISKSAAYFLQALTYSATYVVEKKLIDQYGTKWTDHLDAGGGDGPFKVASYSHTVGMDLVPNSNYYGKQTKLQHLKMLISGDTDTTYKAYLAGQYDTTLASAIPPAELASAMGKPDYRATPILVIRYLTMNYLAKPFNNIKIRQAFALAVNKDLLVKTVLRGAQTPTNHYVPQGMLGYDPTLTGPDGTTKTSGDATKAAQLLKAGMQEEGYASIAALPPITFTYYTGVPTIANIATAVIQQWQTVLGVTVKTTTVDFNTIIQQENKTANNTGPLQLWIAGWQADYPDPQDWLSIFFNKGADYNQQNYGQNHSSNASQQQSVQSSLLQADVTNDSAARVKLYNAAEQQIANDAAWIPLYQQTAHVTISPKVQNLVSDALQIIAPDDWANVYISQ